jgi:hypothetical protein
LLFNCRLLKYKLIPSDIVLLNISEEGKQMLKRLGIEYILYHACSNDCIHYKGEYVEKEICPKCEHDSYKKLKNKGENGPPHKILRHMPINPWI